MMHTPNTVHKAVPTIFGRHFAPCFLALTLLAVTPLAAFANNPNAQNPPRPAMPDNDKRHLRGTVVDENGEPLMGVSVSALGSTPLAITDANGKFNVSAPANATQLTFSYVGMATQSINIGQRTNFLVTMTVGEQALKTWWLRVIKPSRASAQRVRSMLLRPISLRVNCKQASWPDSKAWFQA